MKIGIISRLAAAFPVWLLFACVTAAAALPDRFPVPSPDPVIRKAAQPSKFLESVGRRAMILGREDGTFEAWVNPVKIVRDFRLSIYFDGALEPVPLSEWAERIEVGPGRSTIVHSHAAFTIRQTWVAAIDRPAAAILLDIDTERPLRLRATFQTELKPMWPASFGGQSSYFEENEHALVMGEGLRRWAAVVGSPLFSKSSEQVGHQMPDRTTILEMDITPEISRRSLIPIVIVASNAGSEQARKLYREELSRVRETVEESDRYYREFAQRITSVETPVTVLNDAFHWAQFAIEKGWQCDDGVGCGLVAGFGPSGASERPGFAWWFGGDAFMNSWSIVDSGDFARARTLLEFFREQQRADGKMPHELTQSLALVDWSKYPYGYYHGDTTGLYLMSAAYYVRRSGDLDFLRQSWMSLDRAYRFLLTAVDEDGLLSNRKAGTAATETGALAGKVVKDVYLQGVWLAALQGYAQMAKTMGNAASVADATTRAAKARKTLEAWFLPAKGWLRFGLLDDGISYDAQSAWQSFALAYGGLDSRIAGPAAASLHRSELSTAWGTRLFATDSPHYDPLGYNDGSVWPFTTGFAMMAEFRNGQPRAALEHLYGIAAMTGLSGAGFLTENLSGDRAQALPRSVPHQLFSSSAVVHPLVSGLLGLDGDAVNHKLTIHPRIPAAWPRTMWKNYRVGESLVSGEIITANNRTMLRANVVGPPLRIEVQSDTGEVNNGSCASCTRIEATMAVAPQQFEPLRLRSPEIGERAR